MQIFFQYTENGRVNQLITRVAITKCPALHPGGEISLSFYNVDVRVKKAVYIPELAHLVDVVVFSKQEKRPLSHEIGGKFL